MSAYNSTAYLKNKTATSITIGSVVVPANGIKEFWNSQNNQTNHESTFIDLRNNQESMNSFISSGTIDFYQDDIKYTYTQQLYAFDAMCVAFDTMNSMKSELSVGKIPVTVDTVKESDGRQIVTNWPVGLGWRTWICGASDDESPPIDGTGRGTGEKILINFEDPGTGSLTGSIAISFNEPVQVKDGTIFWEPASSWSAYDDCDIGIQILPTSASIATGSEGNVVGVEMFEGAYTLYVPKAYAGGTGSHVVDLSSASPVPATNNDGYWNWDLETGVITSISGTTPNGDSHLLNVQQVVYILRRCPMPASVGKVEVSSEKVEPLHPNWNMFLTVRKVTSGSGIVSARLNSFRRNVQ